MTIHKYSFGMYYFYYNNTKYIIERCVFTDTHSGFYFYKEDDADDITKWRIFQKIADIRKEFKDGAV